MLKYCSNSTTYAIEKNIFTYNVLLLALLEKLLLLV